MSPEEFNIGVADLNIYKTKKNVNRKEYA